MLGLSTEAFLAIPVLQVLQDWISHAESRSRKVLHDFILCQVVINGRLAGLKTRMGPEKLRRFSEGNACLKQDANGATDIASEQGRGDETTSL